MNYMNEFLHVLLIIAIFVVSIASILIVIRFTTKIPGYIFRKMLHIVAVLAILPLMYSTDVWWIALSVDLFLIIVIIIVLLFIERFSFYQFLFVEKGKHEVIVSFVLLFSMIGVFIALFWGILGEVYKYIAVVAIMAWGPGDAMAAIVGITFGKRKLASKWIEGTKSVEGCMAMALTSMVFTAISMYCLSPYDIGTIVVSSVGIGMIAMFVELFTKYGLDTISVPIVSAILLYIMTLL